MTELDFRSPFDELRELREVLTTRQIAELTGLRRETISRARPDSRFRRSTERVIGDLHLLVTRFKSANDGNLAQLAPILRRPQALLGGQSLADLVREGQVEKAFEFLAAPTSSEMEQLENFQLDAATEAELRALEDRDDHESMAAVGGSNEQRVTELLTSDPELAGGVEAIERMVHDQFSDEVTIRREAVTDDSGADSCDHLYLRLRSPLPFDAELDRLAEFFDQAENLLSALGSRLTVGNL